MHEYSIARALIARVEAEARARGALSVGRVQVRIGELSGVDGGLLLTAFMLARERTVCAGARLDVVAVGAEWRCTACGAAIGKGQALSCATCGAAAALRQGDEIVLDRIEMEVA